MNEAPPVPPTLDPSRGARLLAAVREALRGTEQDFTTGSLQRALLLLAVPMVLETAMESVFAVCDAFFVARLGTEALATVGLAESMLTLVYAVAFGLSMATTAVVARRIGEKDRDGAARAAVQAIGLAVGVAVLTGVPAAIAAPHLLGLMGAAPAVVEVGTGYTRVLLGTNLVIQLLFVHNAIFRGAGDATLAMRSLWLANAVNIVLDPCLIFGLGPFPELGLTGAAVATTLGRGTGVVYQVVLMRRARGRIAIGRAQLRLDVAVLRRLVRLATNGAAQLLVATASWVALVRIVAGFGSAAVAGYIVAVRIIIFALLPAFGVSNAAATLVGQNLGAGRPDRAERAVWLAGLYNMLFFLVVTALFVSSGALFVRIFTGDPEVLPTAAECLRIISYGYVFYAWGMVLTQAFNGAGDTTTPLWINLGCFWAGQIPLAYLLAHGAGLGPSGVFWAIAISESLLAVVAALVFRRGGWKARQV